ncbi:MAG: MlaD family protein [Candidatus Rokubacteria bacterium]|nr:MlaD family protein [Candidatus Rokubacteria bacterium]
MNDGRAFGLQLRIGAFIIGALVVFLGIIYLLGAQARYFEPKYDLIAEFGEVGGLLDGATVRLAGVQIGRVTNIELSPQVGGKVRVTLTIVRSYMDRIRADSEARILTQGLLGDKLVEISRGSPSAPRLEPGARLRAQDPFELSELFVEGGQALTAVNRLARSLQGTIDRVADAALVDDLAATLKATRSVTAKVDELGKSGALGDVAAAAQSARRITERVEKGPGWLHALLYEEPQALRRLNALLAQAQGALAKTEGTQSAVGVLLAPESAEAARALLGAMEGVGRIARQTESGDSLLGALLADPQYKDVARDLQAVARNFRDVSERVARGEGLLGALTQGEPGAGATAATEDLRVAIANVRAITERLQGTDGTLGALLQDPSVYENLAAFLEGAERSTLLRYLIRSTISSGKAGAGPAGGR